MRLLQKLSYSHLPVLGRWVNRSALACLHSSTYRFVCQYPFFNYFFRPAFVPDSLPVRRLVRHPFRSTSGAAPARAGDGQNTAQNSPNAARLATTGTGPAGATNRAKAEAAAAAKRPKKEQLFEISESCSFFCPRTCYT